MLVMGVERRFGSVLHTPHRIEWLTDNGKVFTADETVALAEGLGIEPCTTPVRSPESNGMAESFVKRFKQDYVYLGDVSSAASILENIGGWFEDYNENHPHRGLNMLSPREFLRQHPT